MNYIKDKSNSLEGQWWIVSAVIEIVFIYSKLTHQINWSWFWIFSPIWGSILLIIAMVLLASWIMTVDKFRRK